MKNQLNREGQISMADKYLEEVKMAYSSNDAGLKSLLNAVKALGNEEEIQKFYDGLREATAQAFSEQKIQGSPDRWVNANLNTALKMLEGNENLAAWDKVINNKAETNIAVDNAEAYLTAIRGDLQDGFSGSDTLIAAINHLSDESEIQKFQIGLRAEMAEAFKARNLTSNPSETADRNLKVIVDTLKSSPNYEAWKKIVG